jgi:hypothetical protein
MTLFQSVTLFSPVQREHPRMQYPTRDLLFDPAVWISRISFTPESMSKRSPQHSYQLVMRNLNFLSIFQSHVTHCLGLSLLIGSIEPTPSLLPFLQLASGFH